MELLINLFCFLLFLSQLATLDHTASWLGTELVLGQMSRQRHVFLVTSFVMALPA
jgi:hypothetical protein